jgi:hypothetical protein
MNPVELMLSKLPDVRRNGNGWSAKCPNHDDQTASLSVSSGNDGRVLLHCHAGCEPEAICSSIGIQLRDLFPTNGKGNGLGKIVATYDYRDANDTLLFQVVRFNPKAFRQRRPDGEGRWIWKLGKTCRVLYRLPELIAADRDEWRFVVEGEKDADALADVGGIATTAPQGAGKWSKLSDDSALHGRRVAIIPDNDSRGIAHAREVARRLHGKAEEVRIVELPGDRKDVSEWLAAGGTLEQLLELVAGSPPFDPPPDAEKSALRFVPGVSTVLIETDEHRVVSETIVALAADPEVYQRGNILVRVLRQDTVGDAIRRAEGTAVISALPTANLRERMTRVALFVKQDKEGDEIPTHPTPWLVSAVDARGNWPGIRNLVGISDVPVLRSDGSVWQVPGYDERTGVLYDPADERSLPTIPDQPTMDEVRRAVDVLRDIVVDFPFESPEHFAAWLAALLTVLARYAFAGPTPLFLFDANIRGAGKGLLVQVIAHIVIGQDMPVSSYAHESEEMRKRLTSLAIAGDRMVLFDNLEGPFGNDALDRALTSTRWKDRILGKNKDVDLPLIPTWFATGNNVQVAADTMRRVIHVRLDCMNERPEEREGFRHPNLLAWVNQHRDQLLCSALVAGAGVCGLGRASRPLPYAGEARRIGGHDEGRSGSVDRCLADLRCPGQRGGCVRHARTALPPPARADSLRRAGGRHAIGPREPRGRLTRKSTHGPAGRKPLPEFSATRRSWPVPGHQSGGARPWGRRVEVASCGNRHLTCNSATVRV